MDNEERNTKLGYNALRLVENKKGILAADESPTSMANRFNKYNMENTFENRKKFRELLFTTSELNDHVAGIILHEETFEQKADDGTLLVDLLIKQNIAPGIKLDKGLIDYKDNEKVSVGLEDLEKRLQNEIYRKAVFAKWRSVFTISESTPTTECIFENCLVLAKYAQMCQRFEIVPIVEPEILWEGDYDIALASKTQKIVLSCLLYQLNVLDVYIPGVIIKTNFVTNGKSHQTSPKEAARHTFDALMSTVAAGIPAIVFLSGGHGSDESMQMLSDINKEKGVRRWALSFSYGRAISDPVMKAWVASGHNVTKAQEVFKERLCVISKAVKGEL